jgi:tetratricopeptide (TPR) repeat protein
MDLCFHHQENCARIAQLGRRIRSGQKVAFLVGSAVSLAAPASMPSVETLKRAVLGPLAESLAPELRAMLLAEDGTPTETWQRLPLEVLYQQMTRHLGRAGLESLSVFVSRPSDRRYNASHLVLAAIASRFHLPILTTNWDLLLEQAACALGQTPDPIVFWSADDDQRDSVRGQVRIIKIHGSADVPQSLVATVDQAGERLPRPYRQLINEYLDGAVLCLAGYGANDYDVYQALVESSLRELWLLLRPPEETVDAGTYAESHRRPMSLLDRCEGVPIICDIVEFFDQLMSETTPGRLSDYASLRKAAHDETIARNHAVSWARWASRMEPSAAYKIAGDVYHFLGDGWHSMLFYSGLLEGALVRDAHDYVLALLGQSYASGRMAHYWRAMAYALRGLCRAVPTRSRPLVAHSLYAWADALWLATGKKSPAALVAFAIAERLYRGLDEPARSHGRASCLQHICLYALLLPPRRPFTTLLKRALAGLNRSYQMFHGPNGNALRLIASAHRRLGDTTTALAKAQEALDICGWYGDGAGTANCHRELARIWLSQRNHPDSQAMEMARTHLQEAVVIARRLGDRSAEAKAASALTDLARAT